MKEKFPLCALLVSLILLPSRGYAQKTHFTVGFSAYSAAFMAAFVADQQGYFSQEGVGVTLVFFRSGVQLMQSVVSGNVQVGMGSASELVAATNAGARIRTVWGISNLMPYALISRPSIRTFEDLKGKKIAVSAVGALSDFLTRYTLRQKGLDPSRDVTIIAVGGVPTRFAAVQTGAVDASLISAAHFKKAKESGLNLLFMLSDLIPQWPLDLIYVRDQLLSTREREFQAYLSAYRRGVATAKKNPESAISALQKSLRFDRDTAKEGYHAYVDSIPDDGQIAEKGLELIIQQMAEEGAIKKRYPVSDLINYTYMTEAGRKGK